LTDEEPGEEFAKGGVASAKGVNGIRQLLKAGVVIRLEYFALDDRK
jgi:hypothetical protein